MEVDQPPAFVGDVDLRVAIPIHDHHPPTAPPHVRKGSLVQVPPQLPRLQMRRGIPNPFAHPAAGPHTAATPAVWSEWKDVRFEPG